jgi:hypothetical protein
MSAGDDDPFARWSRRKQAVRNLEAQAWDEDAQVAGAAAAEADAGPQLPATAPAAAEPPEPMPSLEDLAADGDLSAFLREGVPAALKNAAMRKMWSLDPAIRDYIGPAEYAWDFNQPGSMAGFGALEQGRSVTDFLSTMSRVLPADSRQAVTSSEAPTSPPGQVTAAAPARAASFSPAETVQPRDAAADPQPSANVGTVAAQSAEDTCLATSPRTASRPRHGGALPR